MDAFIYILVNHIVNVWVAFIGGKQMLYDGERCFIMCYHVKHNSGGKFIVSIRELAVVCRDVVGDGYVVQKLKFCFGLVNNEV